MRLLKSGLVALLIASASLQAFAADNYTVTQGTGKTMRCADLSTVCFPVHMTADHLGNLIDPMPSTGGTVAAISTITSPSNTPTISTNAYTTGMVLGGIQSFTAQPNTGVIANAHVQFASGTFSGSVDLELFNASPTGGGTTDHATYALTATDTAKKIGELHLNDCTSDGGALVSCQNLYQSQFYTLAAAGTTIFAVAVARGTPTFAGTTDAIFGLQVVK